MKHKLWETIRLASLGNGSCIIVLGGGVEAGPLHLRTQGDKGSQWWQLFQRSCASNAGSLQWLGGRVHVLHAHQARDLTFGYVQGLVSPGSKADVNDFVGKFVWHAGGASAQSDGRGPRGLGLGLGTDTGREAPGRGENSCIDISKILLYLWFNYTFVFSFKYVQTISTRKVIKAT